MPVEILLTAQATPTLAKGAIVAAQPAGWEWGSSEGLPSFVQVTITDATKAEINKFLQRWSRELLLTVESRAGNTVTLKLTNDGAVRSDGEGGFSRSAVEAHINEWGATIIDDTTPGELLFTVSSFGIVASNLFWNADVSSVVFTDLGLTGGVQKISADYSAMAASPNVVSQRIITNRGEVISNDGAVIVFEFDTDDIKHYFRDSMQEFRGLIAKRRYRFRSAAVDAVIANGGHMDTDKATALANILDAAA